MSRSDTKHTNDGAVYEEVVIELPVAAVEGELSQATKHAAEASHFSGGLHNMSGPTLGRSDSFPCFRRHSAWNDRAVLTVIHET